MRYAFAKTHISELITDFFLDFYSSALRLQTNYIFHLDTPRIDENDAYFIDNIRRAYKTYAAFFMGDTYFDKCFTMQNIDGIDFCYIRLNVKTKVNTMVTIHICNTSQVPSMVIYIYRLIQKHIAHLTADNPSDRFFMGDITIIVQQVRKNKKFLVNGKDDDIFQLAMQNYISETKKKGKVTLLQLDYKELIHNWQLVRRHDYPNTKVFPDSHYYKYFRNPRMTERIKRLKGSLS